MQQYHDLKVCWRTLWKYGIVRGKHRCGLLKIYPEVFPLVSRKIYTLHGNQSLHGVASWGILWESGKAHIPEVFTLYLENIHPWTEIGYCMGCTPVWLAGNVSGGISLVFGKKYTPLHRNQALYGVHNGVAWWECIPRYSPGIWNSGSVSYPHFPSGKPVWPHIAQFQNRDKDDQNGNSSKHNSQCQPYWCWNMALDWSWLYLQI